MVELNIHTYNANGLERYEKRSQVFQWWKNKNPDILLLQETHSIKNKETRWKNEWGGPVIFSHGTSNSRGVCICLNPELDHKIIDKKRETEGRIIILDIIIRQVRFTITNIYAPNDDIPEFFLQVFKLMEEFPNEYTIFGGDLL